MKLNVNHPALAKAVTIHPKMLRQPTDGAYMLKDAANNVKLSKGRKYITKGKWRGLPMFSLTLEERRTCPSSCKQWRDCYGNNMPLAHRFDHASPNFYEKLADELQYLLTRKHTRGILVRLHVLGDFPDAQYVRWWGNQLVKYPELRLFGFTAHTPDSPVGQAIAEINANPRCWVRFSNSGATPMAANVGDRGPGIPCPEQTGKTESCLTCGICWSTTTPVNFKEH